MVSRSPFLFSLAPRAGRDELNHYFFGGLIASAVPWMKA
jgi:hypothetical protein